MSEWQVQVVRLGEVTKHPNADTLSVTHVHGGYPVIFRTGEFQPGDLAVYVPVDSIVPKDDPRWTFLGEHRRIRAKRLRGTFSMGLLTAAPENVQEGEILHERLHITKYEPLESLVMSGENEHCPFFLPIYTDVEGLRKWESVLQLGEQVVITEKIHGANARFVFAQDRLWVGSHRGIKKENAANLWWRIATQYHLAERLVTVPNIVLYGEVYGQVQDLKYGVNGIALAFFDAMDLTSNRYYDHADFETLLMRLDLPGVPVLYRGPWSLDAHTHAEGQSILAPHVREGFVVRPVIERFDERIGRVILKLIGQGYHLRKEG